MATPTGFAVFMRNLPPELTDQGLSTQLESFMNDIGVKDWDCFKQRSKSLGNVTFLHRTDGERFLGRWGEVVAPGVNNRGQVNTRANLFLLGKPVFCTQSDRSPDAFLLKHLAKKANDRVRETNEELEQDPRSHRPITFDSTGLSCGHFEYPQGIFTYTADIKWPVAGIAKFVRDSLVITFKSQGGRIRVEIPNRIMHDIMICSRSSSLVLTLLEPPKFFIAQEENELTSMMQAFGFSQQVNTTKSQRRTRINAIPHENVQHADIVGQSMVYRISCSPSEFAGKMFLLQKKDHLNFTHHEFRSYQVGQTYMVDGLKDFNKYIAQCSPIVPFEVLFQLQALVDNAYLLPQTVQGILALLLRAMHDRKTDSEAQTSRNPNGKLSKETVYALCPISAGAVKKLFSQIPFPAPDIGAENFDAGEIWKYLEANQNEIDRGLTQELISERARQNLTMIHKLQVTPTRIVLLGPEPEAKNRILRKFPRHTSYQVRVQFCDEDGQDLFYNNKVSLDTIYDRFRTVMRGGIPIAGRMYHFLGFSHSSLRAHAVWFMAAFVDGQAGPQTHFSVIEDLGDFQHIRTPARCAARIGQAFSETPWSTSLEGAQIEYIPDVRSADGTRVFSDGVGTISRELAEEVLLSLPPKYATSTCFQIRWAGAKGMLSLDDTLEGRLMRIRPDTMIKFESNDTEHLEICDAANEAITLVLNRQMIKILEDMQVPDAWFERVQNRELDRLRKIVAYPDNTVIFLKQKKVASQIRFSQFIRRLQTIGINYKRDAFLCSVIETVVLREVRLLKHKARIPVEKGVTLFGVMDEFGFLDEDEVYITFDKMKGTHYEDLEDLLVIVTRSPALHPGDVQIRTAVVPPKGHPLRSLSNCIVFSQKGSRDLPSQLSGGDLDGDIYNIIWDSFAVDNCKREFAPADYPRVAPRDIGRSVRREDIIDFFVQFMSTDQLGVIANRHIVLADMHDSGTVHEECQLLAQMHSTAVDYSKTGIPVDMSIMRDLSKTHFRPEFMASAPPANIVDRMEIQFEPAYAPESNVDEDDEIGPKYRYYESIKVLGKLYRAIDEKKIWKDNIHIPINHFGKSIWDEVLLYVLNKCQELGKVDWKSALGEARSIRQAYEGQIWTATLDFSEKAYEGITELEVFTGSIFNKSGIQTRRQRDKSVRLKDEFDRICKWTEALILKQDRSSQVDADSEDDEDLHHSYKNDAGYLGHDASALELSVACLQVGVLPISHDITMKKKRHHDDYQSFRVVAAHCALRELETAIKLKEIAEGASSMSGGFPGVSGGWAH
ncbi:RdRP-domain-containing protein [Xylariaceae sp. FL0016]|nr:RdRP-domain-containing protein [Xylariaceae sp. FL0016]